METYDGPPPTGVVLNDTTSDINDKVNNALRAARGTSGSKSPALETALFNLLGKPVPPKLWLAPIESWAMGLQEATAATSGKIYQPLAANSQYQDTTTVVSIGGLAPIMLVNKVLIGTDKLGHFFQIAYTEYYQRRIGAGSVSHDDAVTQGDKSEAGILGLGRTGVFSYGDIAANQAGLRFYEELAKTPAMTFDISKYVTDKWNEQSNPNLYGGQVSSLWKNNIPGKWAGTFSWKDGSTLSVAPVAAVVNATGARSYDELKKGLSHLEGTYQYVHPNASFTSGVLTGTIESIKNADGAIYRLDLNLEWSEGPAKGKGTMTMVSMNKLDGKWGRLGSDDDGGSWTFHKI